MNDGFVSFDDIWKRVVDAVVALEPLPDGVDGIYLVRNLYGQVAVSVSDTVELDTTCRLALDRLAARLGKALGAHAAPKENAILFVPASLLAQVRGVGREVRPRVHLVDRLVTAGDWWTVGEFGASRTAARCALYSIKGGVGRSTTAAVLAWHLARTGQRVLVVDLDLESPGLSSALLERERRPDFGVTDWFVEALVGQEEHVIERMTAAPRWAQDFDGDVRVVPAHGREAGEYLAKLGRVHMDAADDPWTARLGRLLEGLENAFEPDVVVLESRSGLHDIAAATVTDLGAQVLLFATDSESNWTDYRILFRHWQRHELAERIRERLSIVSALTPDLDTENYVQRFREHAWDLFRDHLYDEVRTLDDSDPFSFDVQDEGAPHDPLVVHWTRGLAAGASLRDLETDVDTVRRAYAPFLGRFDRLLRFGNDGAE